MPVTRQARDQLDELLREIDNFTTNRLSIPIEHIRDLFFKIAIQDFEFPIFRIQPLIEAVAEKIPIAIDKGNLYWMEVLLDCLHLVGIRNEAAEQKYYELVEEATEVAQSLLDVVNLEQDDGKINEMLDGLIRRANRLGMRGELVDSVKALKWYRETWQQELMQ